ncbi:hypothetical protein CLD06_06045 [Wolbachia endosymbiont of Drosophila subpulchrella]|uniref:hypothetical protein n=1 Tax=Wolbachia endosymbiont of Drosophila subpulchrella TaxID=2033655 RepID=UPI000BB11823|nr:hypothetical protein [Wolbachia endosymbiont of Drosophila subpulchrella]PBD15464.1 hypothetical protein CLD06_06045 [Wolbachia endosymbiont of Drosophila subpulchrella]
MSEKFELFRLSLMARPQRDLILDDPKGDPTKEEYLRKVFNKKYMVSHRGTEFYYVPLPSDKKTPPFLGGRIGRSFENIEFTPPDQGFNESLHKGWKALAIVLDPSPHDDGQKIAVEVNREVGQASAILGSLIERINQEDDAIYMIDHRPIIDAETFWQFAKENKGNITNLKFEFTAPNMFGGRDSIQEELRAFRDNERAQKVSIALTSPDGINTDTERVHEGVDYAEKGGGDITARTKNNRRYNSKNKVKITHIAIDSTSSESKLSQILNLARNVLGHE